MIYKRMTAQQHSDLKARTDVWLQTDIKEYKSGLALLHEWIHEDATVRAIEQGDPRRYISVLRRFLSRLAELTNYPRLIDTPEKRDKLYIASLKADDDRQLPESKSKEVIPPPEIKAEWDRYAHLEEYYGQLSPTLQKKADDIPNMFANRTRLHETVKRYEREKVQPGLIEQALDNLSSQEKEIQSLYDEFESFFTQEKESEFFEVSADAKPSGSFTKSEIDRMKDPVFAALCKEKRIEADKKYLNRKDINNPEQTELRRIELEEWGIQVVIDNEQSTMNKEQIEEAGDDDDD